MKQFVDNKVNVKIKISALWAAIMFCYMYNDFFSLFTPGALDEMLKGMMGPFPVDQGALLSSVILMAIPSVLVFVSLVMPPKLNRIVNIVFSVFYIAIMIWAVYGEWLFYIVMGIIEIILNALIIFYAVKWPTIESN